ncbi:MFS transporter [Pseudokineococcus basanitobsidens]|uniref:MFS transporter n=1 Tax=Pseudokineococcus basanitobsidens TaxID=1926649 RepID=A0ABU8RFQ3_9ACTN
MEHTEAGQRREAAALRAAALVGGPTDLLDFVLPLWAGAALGASAVGVGVLVALEMAVALLARPLAGVLADRRERRLVAAAGAGLYALSCAGYATATLAGSLGVALAAAAVGGVGGSLVWVSLRAVVGERLAEDSSAYARLFSAEETGSWVAFVAGLALVYPVLGYGGVLWACAAACAAGALALLGAPARPARPHVDGRATADGLRSLGRRLRPMLAAVALRSAAGSAIGYLLLLHLQRDLGLDLGPAALVFLPGSVAASVLAPRLHRAVLRHGRRRTLVVALVASSALAVGLSTSPGAVLVAVLWVLSAVAVAAVAPIQQAVVAEASGEAAGRGLGLYESAELGGGAAGALAAGVLFDASSWQVACLVAAVVMLASAVLVPRSVRALGVVDVPSSTAVVPLGPGAVPAAPPTGDDAGR